MGTKFKADTYTNNVTALGTSKDKSSATAFLGGRDLGFDELDGIYETHAIGRRVVDRVVDDATRVDFQLKGTDEAFDWEKLKSDIDDLDAVNRLGDGWRWARLYGGSITIMNVDDGVELNQPFQIDRAKEIRSLEVIESRYAQPQLFNSTLGIKGFRNPKTYTVTTPHSKVAVVHSSRIIRFDGVRIPPTRLLTRGGWGPSVLTQIWEDMRRLGSAMGYSEAILHEISVMLLAIDNYREAMAGEEEDATALKRIFEAMRWGIDNLNTLILDKNDEYREQTRTVTGLSELLEHFISALVRATDMPRTVLLGEQPGGLNAAADSEVRAWYDHVATQQRKVLTPALNRLISKMFAIRERRGETMPTEWTIEWEPLWQPTDKEKAETSFIRAQAASLRLVDLSAPDEEREQMINDGDITPLEETTTNLEGDLNFGT